MKNILLACTLIISLCTLGACSKDGDGPGIGKSNVSGNFKVDGKKADLKYGYVIVDDYYNDAEYSFYSIDVLKYVVEDKDIEEVNKDFSSLFFSYDYNRSRVTELYFEYNVNYFKKTGFCYDYDGNNPSNYIDFSMNGEKIRCSSTSIPMNKYDFDYDNEYGEFDASFSVEGTPFDVTYLDEDNDYYSTRGIVVKRVTDAKEIAFLKSLKEKHKNLRNK